MEEAQKSSYLSLGIFLKLLSRYTRKDKAIAETITRFKLLFMLFPPNINPYIYSYNNCVIKHFFTTRPNYNIFT